MNATLSWMCDDLCVYILYRVYRDCLHSVLLNSLTVVLHMGE